MALVVVVSVEWYNKNILILSVMRAQILQQVNKQENISRELYFADEAYWITHRSAILGWLAKLTPLQWQ